MAIAAAGSRPRTDFSSRRRLRSGVAAVVVAVVMLVVAGGAFALLHSSRHSGSGSSARAAGGSGSSGSGGSGGSGSGGSGASGGTGSAAAGGHPRSGAAVDPFGPALNHWLTARTGDITAAVQDLRGGRIWLYRAGHPEHTASIVKVDILATLLHERQDEGGLTEDERELATGMIESSSDDDASDLFEAEGGAPAVQGYDRSAGMTQTSVNGAWGLTSTTPRDQLKLLHTVLFANALLDPASRGYEYGLMRHIVPYDTWGVTAGPGHRVPVAFKNGWLPDPELWQVNSIGSVAGDGRHYLIAVMTRDDPTWDYGIATIEHISRTTWGDLDGVAKG